MGKYRDYPSQTPEVRPKSEIYTPMRDDAYHRHFYMGVPPGMSSKFLESKSI